MKAILCVAAAALVLWAAPCLASNFVKFGEVEGGSTEPDRSGWSDLKSYKGGVKRNDDGTVEAKETKIRICADDSSVALAIKLATGEVIPEVKIEFERPNPETGVSEVYLRITLCNVTITEIDTELAKGPDEKLEETYCVKYGQIKIANPLDGSETEIDVSGTGGDG